VVVVAAVFLLVNLSNAIPLPGHGGMRAKREKSTTDTLRRHLFMISYYLQAPTTSRWRT
jgi:hypothetical protein